MSAASNYLENELLDHTLTGAGGAYTAPTTVYVALFADSGSGAATALESGTSGTGSTADWGYYEITTSGTAYARQAATFNNASGGSIATSGTISFPPATADYDTAGSTGNVVTHLAIMDNAGGHVLFYGALTNPKTVNSGDQFTISTGNLTVSLA